MFGNVPIVTVAKLDQLNLPKTSPRKEVFTFVETELKDALAILPSLKDLPNKKEYYPRFAKETVQTILAKLYQNVEVYTGTARWQDCVSYCDQVINSGHFTLEPNIWNAFTPTNDQSNELILAVSKDNAKDDPSFTNWMNVLGTWGGLEGAYLNGKLGIIYGGWGGPAVLEEHYDTYENPDFRKSLILKGKYYDGSGKLLIEITPFTNSDIYAFTDKDGEGLTSIKYQPDLDDRSTGKSQRHDLVIYRYADVLLTKAEALSRIAGGNALTTEAANLVNSVRKRNFAIYAGKEFTTKNTIDDLMAERSKEFLWECSYRTDLVRFGKFTTAKTKWKKVDDAATKNIFPIPLGEVQSNPNLTQNPGY
jgi:starch-binding outer membrane protein, SusD/RagB family